MLELDCAPYIEYQTIRDDKNDIKAIKITQVNLCDITEELYPLVEPKNNLKDPIIQQQFNILGEEQKLILAMQMLITRYCIHRILCHHKIWQQEVWMYKTSRDYYGAEVQNICLKPNPAREIERMLEDLKPKSPAEKIEQVLLLEYGYLIPSVVGKKWAVKRIDPKTLEYSNTEHHMRCQHEVKENPSYRQSLQDFSYPRAITLFNPTTNNYKVIDGYHRLVATPTEENPLIIYTTRD